MRQLPARALGGWRTRRSAPSEIKLLAAPAASPSPGGHRPRLEGGSHTSLFAGVKWSPLLIAFLAYIGVIVTYKFRIGDVTMAGALLGLLVQRDKLRLPKYLILFGLFVVWSAVGFLQSNYREVVWDRLIDSVKVFLVALVAINAIRSRAQLRLFAVFFLGCFALFPVRGALFNYFISHYTLAGRAIWNYIYSNPNDLAALTLLQFSMAVALTATERSGWVRWAARAGIVVLPLVILLTQSRGAFIALAAMIATMIAMQRGRRVRLVGSILIVGAIVGSVIPSTAWHRFHGLTQATSTSNLSAVDSEGSAKDRYAVWTVAFRIIASQPLFGVGLGAYPLAHNDFTIASTNLSAGARGYRDTHSTYFNLAAEVGIPGLLLFLGMIATTIRHAERARRACATTLPRVTAQLLYLELGLFGYLVAGVFGSFAKLPFLYLHITLLWATADECLRLSQSIASPLPHDAALLANTPRRRPRGAWRSA